MRSNFLLTVIASLSTFLVCSALPQLSTSNLSRSNHILGSRQSPCSCSTTNGCQGCTGQCCPAGQICAPDFTPFPTDACCIGTSCNPFASPSSSSSTSSPAITSTPSSSVTPTPAPSTLSPSPTTPISSPISSPVSSPTSTESSSAGVATPSTGSSSTSRKKTAAIIGGSVGGGIALIVAAILAFLTAKHTGYLLGVLASALFGFFVFRSRRLVFDVDEDIGETQISLFLTRHEKIADVSGGNSQERIVVWKVFDIVGSQRHFEVTVPCTFGPGLPEIGFGSIEDHPTHIECSDFQPAPAYLDEDDVWHPEEEADKKKQQRGHKQRKLVAKNRSKRERPLAVGTIEKSTDMSPFLLLEDSAFAHGAEYQANSDLYLHAFRTNGYRAGKYKDTIVPGMEGNRLSPENGIKIKDLRPLTSWRVSSAGGGNLKLEIAVNHKDVTAKYKHDFVLKKDARGKK